MIYLFIYYLHSFSSAVFLCLNSLFYDKLKCLFRKDILSNHSYSTLAHHLTQLLCRHLIRHCHCSDCLIDIFICIGKSLCFCDLL